MYNTGKNIDSPFKQMWKDHPSNLKYKINNIFRNTQWKNRRLCLYAYSRFVLFNQYLPNLHFRLFSTIFSNYLQDALIKQA